MLVISKIATWFPPYRYTQQQLLEEFGLVGNRLAGVVFRKAKVDSRNFIVPAAALLTSCTGEPFFPSLSEIMSVVPDVDSVVEVSNFPPVYRLPGKQYTHYRWCPGSVLALDYATHSPGRTLIVTCNLQSYLRWQPDFTDSSDVVNYSLMGDGISAVIAECGDIASGGCPQILGCVYQKKHTEFVGMADGKFRFDARLPAQISLLVENCLDALQNQFSVGRKQITYWIVHPGGIRILNQIEQSLSLPKEALDFSKEVLREHGNISASSVFFILKKIQTLQPRSGTYGTIVSFGPGSEENELLAAACLVQW